MEKGIHLYHSKFKCTPRSNEQLQPKKHILPEDIYPLMIFSSDNRMKRRMGLACLRKILLRRETRLAVNPMDIPKYEECRHHLHVSQVRPWNALPFEVGRSVARWKTMR